MPILPNETYSKRYPQVFDPKINNPGADAFQAVMGEMKMMGFLINWYRTLEPDYIYETAYSSCLFTAEVCPVDHKWHVSMHLHDGPTTRLQRVTTARMLKLARFFIREISNAD